MCYSFLKFGVILKIERIKDIDRVSYFILDLVTVFSLVYMKIKFILQLQI